MEFTLYTTSKTSATIFFSAEERVGFKKIEDTLKGGVVI
jgi:hypothetical protein